MQAVRSQSIIDDKEANESEVLLTAETATKLNAKLRGMLVTQSVTTEGVQKMHEEKPNQKMHEEKPNQKMHEEKPNQKMHEEKPNQKMHEEKPNQ